MGISGRQLDQTAGLLPTASSGLVPGTGIEPVRRDQASADFKSAVSTNSTTRAEQESGADLQESASTAGTGSRQPTSELEAGVGIEPASTALQAAA